MDILLIWQAEALNLAATDLSWRKIAKKLDMPKSTVSDFLRNYFKQNKDDTHSMPKVLIYDIETAPEAAFVFGRFKQFVNQDAVIRPSMMLTFAYKWLGDATVSYECVTIDECTKCDDSRITKILRDLVNQADICIAHNLKGFDHKVANTRMLVNGLKPPSSVRKVDTLEIAKKNFRFPSNKLDCIAHELGIGRKTSHSGIKMWADFIAGDEEARDTMVEYNIQDVFLLEEVYLKLRAWDSRSPNFAQYVNDTQRRCPCCASNNLKTLDKPVPTAVNLFTQYVCLDCGKHSRGRTPIISKAKRDSINANILD